MKLYELVQGWFTAGGRNPTEIWDYRVVSPCSLDDEAEIVIRFRFTDGSQEQVVISLFRASETQSLRREVSN